MVWARFDDLRTGESWQFDEPARVLVANTVGQVIGVLDEVENAAAQGHWAYGYVSYEAAPAFDAALRTHAPDPRLPLVWFAVTAPPRPVPLTDLCPGWHEVGPWRWPWTADRHEAKVAAVRDAIAAGDTYQCNLTTRLDASFDGDPLDWYLDLATAQQGSHHAYLDCDDLVIVSASPESFLAVEGKRATSVPMKGTAPRGHDPATDAAHRSALLASDKDAAENVMIVDLIRNDLSRVAVPGTVTVQNLLCCEEFATVWQLTSTVTAELRPGIGVADLFAALFPCGSITGAPKARTTELITELEDGPRGVYCGTVGWVAPPLQDGDPPRMRFNVAIRTGVVDRTTGTATYGVGGGVTWPSRAADEYAELQAKARILDVGRRVVARRPGPVEPPGRLGLIETFAVRNGVAGHLDRHLARLRRSAADLGIGIDEDRLAAALADLAAAAPDRIVRLELAPDGRITRTERVLTTTEGPVRLAVDEPAVDPTDPLFRHKTTRRAPYERARERHPYADDVIGVNTAGNLTETTIANLVVRVDGQWRTPPVSDGCLPGIGREVLLEQGELVEQSIPASSLGAATEIAVVSSVRGWRRAVLVRPPDTSGKGTPLPRHAAQDRLGDPGQAPRGADRAE